MNSVLKLDNRCFSTPGLAMTGIIPFGHSAMDRLLAV